MHRVPFVSQRVYAFPNCTCGVASTMMLLRFHYRRKRIPTYRDLRRAFGIDYLPGGMRPRASTLGVDTPDVLRYFRLHRIRYRATHRKTRATWDTFRRGLRRAPAMVSMGRNPRRWGVCGHWIVVIDLSPDTVSFLDPWRLPTHTRPVTMRLARFRREWDGTSIQIVGFK